MERRLPDTSKIVTLTGWELTRSLHDIFDDVLAWSEGEARSFGLTIRAPRA